MIKTELWLRKTFRYADGWARSEDDYQLLGEVKLTPRKLVHEPVEFDGTAVYTQTATVPPGLTATDVRRALADTLGGSRCRHTHDCCGCISTSVRTRRLSNRKFGIVLSLTPNY